MAAVATLAVAEYRLGVEAGRIVTPPEYEEATAFLHNALADAVRLPDSARPDAVRSLEALLVAVDRLAPAEVLDQLVAELRGGLEASLGVTLDPMPTRSPSLSTGGRLFRRECAQCHGADGAGDGPLAPSLHPAPANLTAPAMAATTPLEVFRRITVGVAGAAMPAYEGVLTVDERWAVALYVGGLHGAGSDRDAGRMVVAACKACQSFLADVAAVVTLSDDGLARELAAHGLMPTPDVVGYARIAASVEELGGNRAILIRRALEASARVADEAVALAATDAPAAERRAVDAYLEFEAIETEVRARQPVLARAVEDAFGAFRTAAARGDVPAVTATRVRVAEALDDVEHGLARDDSPVVLFGQSLLIILREGLEAILIIGALMAFLERAGAHHRRREVVWGSVAALALSGVAAALVAWVFDISSASQEALEGATILLASIVLFFVASWLVSKIEAARWRAFVGDQMRKALTARGKLALGGLAFLVVFREGVETVLFYGALYGTADGPVESLGVTSGLVLGAVLLAGVYTAIERWGVRLPLRPIFAVTGVLLLVMAFSFAGKGIAELQAAGAIPLTRIDVLPALPILGIFPTIQTLLVQLALILVFLGCLTLLLRKPATA